MTANNDPPNLHPLRLLACGRAGEDDNQGLADYAKRWARLLNGQLDWHLFPEDEPPALPQHYLATHQLILLHDTATFNDARRLQTAAADSEDECQPQPALLLLRRPDWPLRQLLLIIRGEATDRMTLTWGTTLAQLAGGQVTTLVVLPPNYQLRPSPLAQTLQADTLPGRHIRSALDNFAAHQVNGVVKISYSSPLSLLQRELSTTAYDLIILGNEPPGRMFAWRLDTLLDPLLQTTQQSVLITRTAYSPILAPEVSGGGS